MKHIRKWWRWELVFSAESRCIHWRRWGGNIWRGNTAGHRVFSSFHVVCVKSTYTKSGCRDVGRGRKRSSSTSSPSSFEHSVSWKRECIDTAYLNDVSVIIFKPTLLPLNPVKALPMRQVAMNTQPSPDKHFFWHINHYWYRRTHRSIEADLYEKANRFIFFLINKTIQNVWIKIVGSSFPFRLPPNRQPLQMTQLCHFPN